MSAPLCERDKMTLAEAFAKAQARRERRLRALEEAYVTTGLKPYLRGMREEGASAERLARAQQWRDEATR